MIRCALTIATLMLGVLAHANNVEPSAAEIIARAHAAAGGEVWTHPETLVMSGYGLFFDGHVTRKHDQHRMWRVYPTTKETAHQADGKVRIDSVRGGEIVFQIAFDGTHTYNQLGRLNDAPNEARWQASFGFGVIRFALEPDYQLERLPNDEIDGHEIYKIAVLDLRGGKTLFGIDKDSYRIRWLGFDTPRGWHERVYSQFFSNEDSPWVQPGRVRLYYDGVKANEIIWQSFEVNTPIDDALFVLPAPP